MVQSQPFYIPVDTIVPIEQLRRLSREQLTHRTLNDPQYAGFDCNFDWHRYVEVNVKDPHLRTQTIESLNIMAATEEGQHSIRQAYAVRQHALKSLYKGKSSDDGPKIPITERPRSGFASMLITGDCSIGSLGIFLDATEIQSAKLLGANGQYYHLTVLDTLFHEMDHQKDPLAQFPEYQPFLKEYRDHILEPVKKQMKASFGPKLEAALEKGDAKSMGVLIGQLPHRTIVRLGKAYMNAEERTSAIVEYPAILDTNQFDAKNIHSPQRALVHDRSKLDRHPEPLEEHLPVHEFKPLPTPDCKADPKKGQSPS